MALLGDDGRGFELARKLESCGVWRSWLGDSLYSNFVQYLSSPATWESFMRSDDSKSRAQIQLQLRARALLFDKASVSLFLRSPSNLTTSLPVSKLNPSCKKFLVNFFIFQTKWSIFVKINEISFVSFKIDPYCLISWFLKHTCRYS